jgi:hypothetical protein
MFRAIKVSDQVRKSRDWPGAQVAAWCCVLLLIKLTKNGFRNGRTYAHAIPAAMEDQDTWTAGKKAHRGNTCR